VQRRSNLASKAEIVRKLGDRIELSLVARSGRKSLSVSLYGRLAGILAMATKAKAPLDESDASVVVTKLVAGVRSKPMFRMDEIANLPGAQHLLVARGLQIPLINAKEIRN
jgi:hypothetical protein